VGGLGQGGFGIVVEVEDSSSGHRFAMKCLSKKNYSRLKDRSRLASEIDIMTNIAPSPFLLQCHLAFETFSDVFLVMELASGGDLFFHLDQLTRQGRSGFPENQARILLAEISLGLIHLHTRGFVHLDIKIENIMLDRDGHVKLVDFGLSVELTEEADSLEGVTVKFAGSLLSMSPELLTKKIVGRFTDWWAVGVLAHDLLTGTTPWSSNVDKSQIKKDIKSLIVLPPPNVSKAAGDFVVALLQKDRRHRLGTTKDTDVLGAPFFEGIDWAATEMNETLPAFVPKHGVRYVLPEDSQSSIDAYQTDLAFSLQAPHASEFEIDMGLMRAPRAPLPSVQRLSVD
jgi:serine/threonine protein kinase